MLKRFLSDENGQSTVEYILIIAAIVGVVITIMVLLRNKLKETAEKATEKINIEQFE